MAFLSANGPSQPRTSLLHINRLSEAESAVSVCLVCLLFQADFSSDFVIISSWNTNAESSELIRKRIGRWIISVDRKEYDRKLNKLQL